MLRQARDCSDPPEPPGPRGSPQADVSFGSSPGPSLFKSQIFPLEFETKLKAFSTLQPKEFEIPVKSSPEWVQGSFLWTLNFLWITEQSGNKGWWSPTTHPTPGSQNQPNRQTSGNSNRCAKSIENQIWFLKKYNIKRETIDYIVFNRGPGSFTGTRVASSVIQAIAYTHNIPVIGISSMWLMAYQASRIRSLDQYCCIKHAYGEMLYISYFSSLPPPINHTFVHSSRV